MPAIEISQQQYDRLMAFKPLVEQILQEEMSDSEFTDFIAYSAVERLFLESAMSGDLQLIAAMRRGDSALQAALDTLQNAQLTLQALSRGYPEKVFNVLRHVWQNMDSDEQRDKGMGLHVLWERYKEQHDEPVEREA